MREVPPDFFYFFSSSVKKIVWKVFKPREKKREDIKESAKKKKKKRNWKLESLEERVCKPFSLLNTIFCPLVGVVLFHTAVTPLFSSTYPSWSTRVGGKAEEGRGKWKLWSQRWVVIRNITVIGGLSIHLSCRSVFLILASFTKGNYPGSQLKGFSLSLSLIRGLLIHQQWLALNRPRKPVDEHWRFINSCPGSGFFFLLERINWYHEGLSSRRLINWLLTKNHHVHF